MYGNRSKKKPTIYTYFNSIKLSYFNEVVFPAHKLRLVCLGCENVVFLLQFLLCQGLYLRNDTTRHDTMKLNKGPCFRVCYLLALREGSQKETNMCSPYLITQLLNVFVGGFGVCGTSSAHHLRHV